MKSICPSKKKYYHNRSEAEEALINYLGGNYFLPNTGPVNVYHCDLCNGFHFTSKGTPHPMLQDTNIIQRITRLRQASDWENKF